MKLFIFALCSLAFATVSHAQWQTTTYNLKGGWNSIYLHGDASHATPDELFPNSGQTANIEQIWRWNPNPNQIQFTTDPLIPTAGTPEWSVWYRGNPAASTLSVLTGQTAYLVYCGGTSSNSYSVQLKNRPQPPSSTWVRNGANFLGFPSSDADGSYPSMSNYFATFPAAITANTRVFKYVGGELGSANPLQVFSPTFESLDRNQAYWFEAEVTGNFYAPIEIAPSNPAGLEFGRTGSTFAVRIRNRTAAPVTITITPTSSAAAPAGETGVTGDVPLTRSVFNAETAEYDEIPLTAFNQVIEPQSSVELEFGINRSLMTGDSSDLYASFLKFTDGGNLMDVLIPASAQVSSMAGLWVGDVSVDGVVSNVAGSPGDTTKRPFPLRYILHVDDTGTARILSQVFMGVLDASDQLGNCSTEAGLKADQLASAARIVAAHMPLDKVLIGSGTVALPSTVNWTIALPYDAKTNPFVHSYHPDHDNKDPRGGTLAAGGESYTVDRAVSFEFLATPPAGTSSAGWGTTVLGGNYMETLTGIHKLPLTTSGSFTFRRVNEIGAITVAP